MSTNLSDNLKKYGIFLHGMTREQWKALGLYDFEIEVLEFYRDNVGMYALCPVGSVFNGRDAVLAAGIPNDNREHLRLICMDEDNKVLAVANIAVGNSVGLVACKHSILMACATRRATKAVLVHNHEMGGNVSDEDYRFTMEVQELLGLAQIELIDHYVRKEGTVISVLTNQIEIL
jgi:hypothetical protein